MDDRAEQLRRGRSEHLHGEEVQRSFGLAVRARRRDMGISQERLAELSGLSRSYMGDVERGGRNVGLVNVAKIARALDCTIGELFTRYYAEDRGEPELNNPPPLP